jgi:hypothetical protein
MRPMNRLALFAFAAWAATMASPHDDGGLSAALQNAGRYVRAYQEDFAHVIASETYVQTLHLPQKDELRRIDSDALSVLAVPPDGWMWVRNALKVDGRTVADGQGRLDRLVKGDTMTIRQLIALRDESARFNIGHVYRNFNEPTFALRLFDPDVQTRFHFKSDGPATIAGQRTLKVTFVEAKHPTLVRAHDRDAPLSGTAWIDINDGAILRTRLTTLLVTGTPEKETPANRELASMTVETRAEVDAEFERNAVVDAWVPKTMREEYGQVAATAGGRRSTVERVSCMATYSNFRRFSTSARIVAQ